MSINKIDLLSEIIATRRSTFPPMYTGEKIDDRIIKQLLENANWAPTHRMTEPWRFHVFTGEGLNKLSEFAEQWYLANIPADKYSEVKHNKTKNNPLKSSHVIALCMVRDAEEKVPEWEEVSALAMAVQNMWLSCSALGIGCYWSTPANIKDAGQLLKLSENEKCLGWFYIGKPKEGLDIKGTRNPIAEKTTWYS